MNPSTLRQLAPLFGFDRLETELLTHPLSEVLRDAADGAEQDERSTVRPQAC
jgi:hypothetical protein